MTKTSLQEVARRMRTDIFHVDRTNALAIERLLQLASERNIPVFWLLTPLTPGLQAFRDRSGSEAAYEQLVRSARARHPRTMTVLDAQRAAYPPGYFVDATHLNGRGATVLSQAVAITLKAELGQSERATGPRWIALKQSVDHSDAIALGLEDVEKSKRIVGLTVSPKWRDSRRQWRDDSPSWPSERRVLP